MDFNEWLESIIEAGSSTTMDSVRDPAEILDEFEHELIATTGYNLNHRKVQNES
jgi:hypothetical protein